MPQGGQDLASRHRENPRGSRPRSFASAASPRRSCAAISTPSCTSGTTPAATKQIAVAEALGNLGEYLSDRLTANARRFPIGGHTRAIVAQRPARDVRVNDPTPQLDRLPHQAHRTPERPRSTRRRRSKAVRPTPRTSTYSQPPTTTTTCPLEYRDALTRPTPATPSAKVGTASTQPDRAEQARQLRSDWRRPIAQSWATALDRIDRGATRRLPQIC